MIKYLKENKELGIILLVAIIIRFIPLFSYQLSYDELCGLRNSIYPDWRSMVDYGVKLDTHPILVQLIINFCVKFFGYKVFWIKLPFLLFSIGSVVYAYIFSYKWFSKQSAILTAILFSFSYIFLFYAPLARMYASGLFFCTALTFYFFEICFKIEKKKLDYLWFILFALLAAINNHLSALYAFSVAFFGLFFQNRSTIKNYLLACILSVIFYLPHLEITFWQFSQGGIGPAQDGWLAPPENLVLFTFLRTLFGTGCIWIAFLLVFLYRLVKTKPDEKTKRRIILLILFFVNYSIIHLYSLIKAPLFQNSVMLFSAPCFIWFGTSYFNWSEKTGRYYQIFFASALLFQSLYVKDFFKSGVLNQNGYQSEKQLALQEKYGFSKVESYFLGSQKYFVIAHELMLKSKLNYFVGEDFESYKEFANQIQNSKADYLLIGDADLIQLEIVKKRYKYLLESTKELNVNLFLYSNKPSKFTGSTWSSLDSFSMSKPKSFQFHFKESNMQQFSKQFIYKVDSLHEFCFDASSNLNDLLLKEGQVLLAKINYKSTTELKDVGIYFSVTNQQDSTLYFGGNYFSDFYHSTDSVHQVYAQLYVGSELKKWYQQRAKLTCFVWNQSKQNFEIIDFQIELIDYWPKRWAWWE